MRASPSSATAAAALLLASSAVAINVDASDSQSLIDAAGIIAASVMSRYDGNGTASIPGLFPPPYYFWEGGLAWDSLLQYQSLTGDTQYNDQISEALLFQVGPNYNYLPPNQSKSLGNDDQSFWALAAMTAEETGFQAPEADGVDSWLQLAQNVFDSQASRWDNETCGGGLRWQIFTFSIGYDYKNTVSTGNFMNLAARLYANTQNETYADWFNTAAAWLAEVGLYDNKTGAVYDGSSVTGQCKDVNHVEWTENSGVLLSAYAYMTATNSDSVDDTAPMLKILDHVTKVFVQDDVLTEIACLPNDICNVDQLAFRAILARAMATVRDSVNTEANNTISTILAASAQAAGNQCSGGSNDTTCGSDWTANSYDGTKGLSQDLSALNVVLANLPQKLASSSGGNGTSGSSNGGDSSGSSGGSQTSDGNASQTSGSANASASAEAQGENRGEQRAASMFGLLGALGFAVAFFL